MTPTSSIQPSIEMEENVETKLVKEEISSFVETSPVHEIRFPANSSYTQNATATPSMPPVLSYAAAPPFTTPLENSGAIYHTGVGISLFNLFSFKCAKLKKFFK